MNFPRIRCFSLLPLSGEITFQLGLLEWIIADESSVDLKKKLRFQLWQMSENLYKHHETITKLANPCRSKQKEHTVQMEP